jgi:putative heme iron utilization protein
MNEDHRDTMNLYAVNLLAASKGDWRCVACDPDGIDLANNGQYLRLSFPQRITDPGALRIALKDLAALARSRGQPET